MGREAQTVKEITAGDHGRMKLEQHLYSDAIYRINSVVESIIEEDPNFYITNAIQLWSNQLDSFSGEFRWLFVRNEDWSLNNRLLEAIADLPKEFWDGWQEEKKKGWESLANTWPDEVDHNNPDFGENHGMLLPDRWDKVIARRAMDGATTHPCCEALLGEDPDQEKDRIAYHHAFLKLVEGRSFSKEKYHDGEIIKWIQKGMEEVYLDSVHSTRDGSTGEFKDWEAYYYTTDGHLVQWKEKEHFHKPSPESSSTPWQVHLQHAIARTDDIQHIISIPIYDGGLAGSRYGRLVGLIHGAISKPIKDRNKVGLGLAERLRSRNGELAAAFQAAGMARIASTGVTEEDRKAEADGMSPALHHFLQVLPMVQDWKRIEIQRKQESGDWKRFQCWERVGRAWKPVETDCSDFDKGAIMEPVLPVLDMIQGVATWINEGERSAFEGWQLKFEYPDYTLLPKNADTKGLLERQYWKEQLDVWAIVLPKVLLALRREREALRRAVTGIMGRNMSHNIGSHVLARYASKIGNDEPSHGTREDQRSDLLQYLQRRMDFLADVATSDEAFWLQSLSLREQINHLNWETQIDRLNGRNPDDKAELTTGASGPAAAIAKPAEKEQTKPVLLRFITGKEGLEATVKYCGADVYFACPGGEVGVHALFVILENIIRNSARHGNAGAGTVSLNVSCSEPCGKQGQDLLQLEIVDPGSPVCMPASSEPPLHVKINNILKEAILGPDGEPGAENWGLREMQICAHYLRGFSLYDLQNAPRLDGTSDKGRSVPLVLKADCHEGKLKYIIYLQKAKRMAVVRKQPDTANDAPGPEDELALNRKGIIIEEIEDDLPDWSAIGARVGTYEYLVVESGGVELPTGPHGHGAVSLPVRRLTLQPRKINELIKEAVGGGSQWMEPLHKCWAELIRDKRCNWKGKSFFGVSLRTSDGALPEPKCNRSWPTAVLDDGLIFASKDSTSSRAKPFASEALGWLDSLCTDGIAAAWVDHAVNDDFSPRGGGLGQSGKTSKRHQRKRLWVSAESARSGDPHARFLNDASRAGKDRGWEILAAAVSRVAVLDERVQSAGDEQSSVTGIWRNELWRYMGVWTPQKPSEENKDGCNLDVPDFDGCRQFLERPAIRADQFPIDILVVHLTILERLARNRNESVGTVLRCLLVDTEAKDAEVVIVTGRGMPSVARAAGGEDNGNGSALEGVRYLPISALLESLITRPSKLGLMRTLWSAGVPASATG